MTEKHITELADKFACAEVIQAWGVFRDQGRWPELRGTFAPDGVITVSWFSGPAGEFVERCRKIFDAGESRSRHHLYSPMVRLAQDRAVAETAVIIRVRQPMRVILVDLTSYSRFLDRLERRPEGWRIAERVAIYERDRIDPVEPSPAFEAMLTEGDPARYPEQYRYMAFRIAHAEGRPLAPVVHRDGGPETAALYQRFDAWLGGKSA